MKIEPCPLCKKTTCECDSTKSKNQDIKIITAEELKNKIENRKDLLIINVMPQEYHNDCHIKGSINIPLNTLEQEAPKLTKDKEIIVYCSEYLCGASTAAYKQLKNHSFERLYTYKGGIKEWKQKKFPTEGPCTLPYLEQK